MASSDATQRAVLAGLSCGIGLAAPVVMYAATLPFSSVNETVVAGAVPFAVGAVAGVGIYAASLGISEYRAQREERLFQPDAMGGAANLNQHQSEFKTASIPAQQQDATPYAGFCFSSSVGAVYLGIPFRPDWCVPAPAKLASMPIISDAKGVDLSDLDEPAAITASIDAQDHVDTDSLPDASLEEDVPMADYSGHEDMWAAAMAIMAEAAEPAPVAVPTPAASPVSVAPVYVGRRSSVLPEDTARISREGIERAEAIAAGVMENRRHERVDQILEEEINRLQSAAVKRTGRAYLSVIEGGTASFTPLRAEA